MAPWPIAFPTPSEVRESISRVAEEAFAGVLSCNACGEGAMAPVRRGHLVEKPEIPLLSSDSGSTASQCAPGCADVDPLRHALSQVEAVAASQRRVETQLGHQALALDKLACGIQRLEEKLVIISMSNRYVASLVAGQNASAPPVVRRTAYPSAASEREPAADAMMVATVSPASVALAAPATFPSAAAVPTEVAEQTPEPPAAAAPAAAPPAAAPPAASPLSVAAPCQPVTPAPTLSRRLQVVQAARCQGDEPPEDEDEEDMADPGECTALDAAAPQAAKVPSSANSGGAELPQILDVAAAAACLCSAVPEEAAAPGKTEAGVQKHDQSVEASSVSEDGPEVAKSERVAPISGEEAAVAAAAGVDSDDTANLETSGVAAREVGVEVGAIAETEEEKEDEKGENAAADGSGTSMSDSMAAATHEPVRLPERHSPAARPG